MAAVRSSPGLDVVQTGSKREDSLINMQSCGQEEGVSGQKRLNTGQRIEWPVDANTQQTNRQSFPQSSGVDLPTYRSPESVEMDEIMAAMVLTSLSCSPVVQSPPQRDLLPGDMECCGGELSDSGSSGYWSWDHGSVSPAPSPSVTEMDRRLSQPTDEGLHMELDQTACEELEARRCKSLSRGAYRCLWPGCEKVLTSRVGMKRHIRILHLGQTTAGCQDAVQSSPLSQSAPSSVWQIHTEHLYQACAPIQVTVSPGSPTLCSWTLPGDVQQKPQMAAPRSRSVSVGEQWLQRNSAPTRSQTMSASPSRGHCSFRKGRGEAKKCRKVYGVERRDQWCTACRWKKACQRFPD
ncbi:Zinc finger protein 395 [Triplophysa tibetana]|uniref:Zinc finger protein 395 n=1 Tax=Triplophysa tibetana TaxID=1572043 RepID=A0A5A9NHZ5_9TELE|nr:Zinc finger protein 395 [Triplophysa tibetana]